MTDNRKESIRKSITQVGINPIFKDVMANKPPEGYTKTKTVFIDSIYDMIYHGKAVPLENYGITFQDVQDFANGELDLNIQFDLNNLMVQGCNAFGLTGSLEDFSSMNYFSLIKKISEKIPWSKTFLKNMIFSYTNGFSTKDATVHNISPFFYSLIMEEMGFDLLKNQMITKYPELLQEYEKLIDKDNLSLGFMTNIQDHNAYNMLNTLIYYKFFDFEPIRYIMNVGLLASSSECEPDEMAKYVFTFLISDTKVLMAYMGCGFGTGSLRFNYEPLTKIFYKNAGNGFTPIAPPTNTDSDKTGKYIEIFGQDLQYYLDHGGDINVIREWAHAAGSEETISILHEYLLLVSEDEKEVIQNNPDLTEEEKQEQIKEVEDALKFYETLFEKFDSADICFFLLLGVSINPELDEFMPTAPRSNNTSFSLSLRHGKLNANKN